MISYWKSYSTKEGFIYSCDMIRIKFELYEDDVDKLNNYLNNVLRMDITMYNPSFKSMCYKYLFTIDYGDSTMSVGCCFNGYDTDDKLKGFIEFNPNKTFCSQLVADLYFIHSCCFRFDLARFDIAIDLPYSRECVDLLKDNRSYKLIKNSNKDKTEYLGQKNSAGYVKLYNKTLEFYKKSKKILVYDSLPSWTRLEITFDGSSDLKNQLKYVPVLKLVDNQESIYDNFGLSKTQLVMCQSFIDSGNPEYYISQLDNNRLKKKFRDYIYQFSLSFLFDLSIGKLLLSDIKDLCLLI